MNCNSSSVVAIDPVVPRARISDLRAETLAALIREHRPRPVRRLLAVGCGSGKETAVLAETLGAEVIGIDLAGQFDPAAAAMVDLRRGDATDLEFPDRTFDCVYCCHTLEHTQDHFAALREMRRVLAEGGSFCIGVANRLRLLGYGAQAGFSSAELRDDLRHVFGNALDITLPCYQRVHRGHAGLCRLIDASLLGQILYPSVYFIGHKAATASGVAVRRKLPSGRTFRGVIAFRGQFHHELAALADLAVGTYHAAMHFHQIAHQRQPYAQPALRAVE